MSATVRAVVRMTPELRDRLDEAAAELVVSRSLIATKAITEYLDRRDDALARLRTSATYDRRLPLGEVAWRVRSWWTR